MRIVERCDMHVQQSDRHPASGPVAARLHSWSFYVLLTLAAGSGTSLGGGMFAAAGDVPPEMAWLHSALPTHCFVSVHAESLNTTTGMWDSGSWRPQPFKTTVDPSRQAVYWHKDMMESFYGELWEYDDDTIRLRQETFPKFPAPFENASLPWDVRPDKFRLYFSGGDLEQLPGGKGRVLAPRHATTSWRSRANTSTNLCSSWAQFEGGQCAPFQRHFLDSAVYLTVPKALDTAFDGRAADPKWYPDASMQNLRDVVVINQEQSGDSDGPTVGRERFFFASFANGTRLGIVRWDGATVNASAPDGFTVTQRTVGLRTACDPAFNSRGFAERRDHDRKKLANASSLTSRRVFRKREADSWSCHSVVEGEHYATPPFEGFVECNSSSPLCTREVVVRFDANTANYSCDCGPEPYPSCMTSWNKLWGSSRCGKLHPHHEDSDRFVWRRLNTTSEGLVSIAAYAYDKGVKPYSPPDPNLLQPFDTPLAVGKRYLLSMVRSLSRTMYELREPVSPEAPCPTQNGGICWNFLEAKAVLHANHCPHYGEGYNLGFYYGGQCAAPQKVTACYANESMKLT